MNLDIVKSSDAQTRTMDLLIYCETPRSEEADFASYNPLLPEGYAGCKRVLWYHPYCCNPTDSLAHSAPECRRREVFGMCCYRGRAQVFFESGSVKILAFWPIGPDERADIGKSPFDGMHSVGGPNSVRGLSGQDCYVQKTVDRDGNHTERCVMEVHPFVLALLCDLLPRAYRQFAPQKAKGKKQ